MKFENIPLSDCPRPGYPRPDFRRPLWQNLNGEWEFEEDPARSGNDRGLFKADKLLDLIGKLTANTNNTTLKTIGSLAGQYDGLKIGLELQK
jgi:hypothetical protein